MFGELSRIGVAILVLAVPGARAETAKPISDKCVDELEDFAEDLDSENAFFANFVFEGLKTAKKKVFPLPASLSRECLNSVYALKGNRIELNDELDPVLNLLLKGMDREAERFVYRVRSDEEVAKAIYSTLLREIAKNERISRTACGNRSEFLYHRAQELGPNLIRDAKFLLIPPLDVNLHFANGQDTYWVKHVVLVVTLIESGRSYLLDSMTRPSIVPLSDKFTVDDWKKEKFSNAGELSWEPPPARKFRWDIPWDPAVDGGAFR